MNWQQNLGCLLLFLSGVLAGFTYKDFQNRNAKRSVRDWRDENGNVIGYEIILKADSKIRVGEPTVGGGGGSTDTYDMPHMKGISVVIEGGGGGTGLKRGEYIGAGGNNIREFRIGKPGEVGYGGSTEPKATGGAGGPGYSTMEVGR